MPTIELFDSTLRDGAQGEGISFSVQDKLNIVRILDEFGVSYIEAGNPGSNPKDITFFEELKKLRLKKSVPVAFGATARFGRPVTEDANVQNLLAADTPAVAIFGKCWDLHVREILKITEEDNLTIVRDTVAYLKAAGKEVIFDAEHFFDGYRASPDFALRVLTAAVEGGADVLALCDTNGGTLPDHIRTVTERVVSTFPGVRVGIHCHNDIGCAVASSMAAVFGGAVQVQGTLIGFGERCGNADLSTILANLALKCGYDCGVAPADLREVCTKIAEISNVRLSGTHPYIGKSAFAHKAGMHIDGVQKCSESFEHISPEAVGNARKFLVSEVAGRGTILPTLQKFIPTLTKSSPETGQLVALLKEREYQGYQYEGASASFELLIKKELGLMKPHFHVVMYKSYDDFPAPDGDGQSTAMVKIEVDGKTELSCAAGNGPVNALDKAFRKAIRVFYPRIDQMELADYKVRVISNGTTDATVRVLIDSHGSRGDFTTVGVSCDIIEASFTALTDSYEYELNC